MPIFDLSFVKKVLITDDCHPYLIEALTQLGFSCDFEPEITPEETLQRIADYTGLIINSKINVNRSFIDAALQLRFVGRLGSGMEIVDRPYATERGIAVISSPEGNRNAVAEQALGMLLALANNLLQADREVRQNIWRREANRGFELRGKTMGIIGFGHTGSQFARVLSGLGMHIIAFDKYKTAYVDDFPGVQEGTLEEIQTQADVISLHLPLTPETKHYVDQAFIAQCRPGVVLVNTSRGQCIKTDDLIAALETRWVQGACLDVFENEKPGTFTEAEFTRYDRLHALDNVVLAPHIAGWTHESKARMAAVLIEKIKTVLSKQ